MKYPLLITVAIALIAASHTADGESMSIEIADVVHFEDIQNREPMLVELADGTLLVTGFPRYPHEPARAPSLWRSTDGGSNWERVDVGGPDDGAIGNSDVDLTVAPDGTIYFVTMGFNRTTREGTHVSLGVSEDDGASWRWTELADNPRVDRPWVVVADDAAVHVIWNDGTGVFHTLSHDRGQTFAEAKRLTEKGGSSHFAAGPNGRLAFRVTPISASGNELDPDFDFLMISDDGGYTWRRRIVPGTRNWERVEVAALPRWVEPLAWTADGSLFHLWSEGREMYLARSRNDGRTWDVEAFHSDEDISFFPWLAADNSGGLVATWFAAADGMSVRAATIDYVDGEMRVTKAPPLRFESWGQMDGQWRRDTAGEYVPMRRLADGSLAVVTPLSDPRDDRMGFTFWRLAVQGN